MEDKPLINTTAEEDWHARDQHRINIIWEVTQAVIATSVSAATLYVSAQLTMRPTGTEAAFILLSNAFFLVIGFYFGRTNHARPSDIAFPRDK